MAVHKELITAGKFNEKFKKPLVDYYNYGFKNLESYEKTKRETISKDWLRLTNICSDYLEWSNDRKKVMFANTDSLLMNVNPFHRVYRFCYYTPLKSPGYFFNTIAALSQKFQLRNGVSSLNLDYDLEEHLNNLINNKSKLKTSDLICFYTDSFAQTKGKYKNKGSNSRLIDLNLIGLIECEQYKSRGDRRWSLPELTLDKIIEAGLAVDENFDQHLYYALDFFSKFYLFGEIGTFLLDRFTDFEVSPFRSKHEYFTQSLNDFNILDLLYAIENNKWCKIRYSHNIAGFETELLCYPLEIRISSTNGREYLMYYEPFHRSYTALRLEFIDSIEFYEEKKVKSIPEISSESVDADIANARKSLQYSWGVSTTKKASENTKNIIEPHSVSFRIAFNPDSENYIRNRLYRERRFGIVSEPDENNYLDFSVNVSDEVELRPWIRSFYSRLISWSGMDTDTFSVKSDVERMEKLFYDNKLTPPSGLPNPKPEEWRIPDSALETLGTGITARAHELLFNEVFSVYYYVIADVLARICSDDPDKSYSKSEITGIIRDSINKYDLKIGYETKVILPGEIKDLLLQGGFLYPVENEPGRKVEGEARYIPKYTCDPGIELYRDVIPLSKPELRWLKTIMTDADSKIKLFMSDSEIAAIDSLLKQHIPDLLPFPMDKIVYFDRFHSQETNTESIASVFSTILKCINDQKTAHLKYLTKKNRAIIGEFKPIVFEFSKRNNQFQVLAQNCIDNKIFIMNISQIEEAIETETTFDYITAEQALFQYRKDNSKSVTVEFYNTKNLVDRILTEFSPWKKLCSYDPTTKLYTLTINYQKQDELELVVRFLGYGCNLKFVCKEDPIAREVWSRIARQMDLIRNTLE